MYPYIKLETESEIHASAKRYAYFKARANVPMRLDKQALDYCAAHCGLVNARQRLAEAWHEINNAKELLELIANGDPLAVVGCKADCTNDEGQVPHVEPSTPEKQARCRDYGEEMDRLAETFGVDNA